MSTLFELIDKHNVKYSDNLERMIEEYFDTRFPEPEPQPIDKLFEMKEDTYVWVKWNNGFISLGKYEADYHLLEVEDRDYDKRYSMECFQSFVLTTIPNF